MAGNDRIAFADVIQVMESAVAASSPSLHEPPQDWNNID